MTTEKSYNKVSISRANELKESINSAISKASTLSIDKRIEFNKELDKLRGQQEIFAAMVQKLRESSAESLQSVDQEIDIIWSKIKEQLRVVNDKAQ